MTEIKNTVFTVSLRLAVLRRMLLMDLDGGWVSTNDEPFQDDILQLKGDLQGFVIDEIERLVTLLMLEVKDGYNAENT